MSFRPLSVLGLAGIVLLAAACAPESEEEDSAASSGEAITKLDAYWADATRLDLGDLTRVAVGFATDGLNDTLSSGGNGVAFEAPQVFAAHADPNLVLPSSTEVKALDTVVSGLASKYGEHELGTEVNAVRLKHLDQTADDYYVESAFSANAALGHDWSFSAGGFNGASITLGLDSSAQLSSRVILATKKADIASLVASPLAAAKGMRGFVYPRSVADVRAMKPGEMFALRGLGKLGANFGVGAPLLVAEPTAGLAYRIVVSAGVSGVIGGQLDVQLVRLEGDEVVVDVGVENGKGTNFHASITDGWGIKGICEDGTRCLRTVNVAGAHVDLAQLVEKAVEKRMNQYLTVNVDAQAGNADTRISVARYRFHLDRGAPGEVEAALQQALKFDVRLAQALYNRDLAMQDPPVAAELDAVRASTTSMRSFGFELLGMNVYHRAVVENQGTFVLQTPDGVRSILFDTVHKEGGGWFQRDHAYTRTAIAAETLDARNPDAFKSEANLFAQTVEGVDHMNDDFVLDHLDAVIVGLAGTRAIDVLDTYGNQLERMVWSRCPAKAQNNGLHSFDDACNARLLDDAQMKSLKAQGLAALEPVIAGLAPSFQDVVRKAATSRLILQSTGIHDYDTVAGPGASFSYDIRLDDTALGVLASKSKAEYAAALREYLEVLRADRRSIGAGKSRDDARAEVDQKWGPDIQRIATAFDQRAAEYRNIVAAEGLVPVALAGKRYVSYPLGIRFAVNHGNAADYTSGDIVSTSEDRSRAAGRMFDQLVKASGDLNGAPLYKEQHAALPLLGLIPQESLAMGFTLRTDPSSSFFESRERFVKAGFKSASAKAQGAKVSTISAGMFDLDAVVGLQ